MADYAIHDTTLTGIANTIRKKDGTQALIDPAEYADRINLMGMLEEKTVSGSVASCSDGADGVPVKNWGVTVDANLSGVSSVVCTQAGKNFLDPSIVFENTTIYTYDSATGAVTVLKSDSSAWNSKTELPLKAGTYAVTNPTGRFQYRLASESYGTDHNITATTGTITLSADDGIKIKFGLGTTYPFTASYQLERNNTATTYEPYTAPTVSTVNLGRTIYGGTADVVNGTGKTKVYKQTYTGDNVGTVSITYGQAAEGYTHLYFNIADIPLAYNPSSDNVISNITLPWNNNASAAGIPAVGECWHLINGGSPQKPIIYMYINQTWANVAAFKTWLNANPITVVYEVADEETFTFTPITPTPETALGVNNFWADDNSAVTYRADINMLIASLSGNRGLMMSRPQLEEITEETKEESPEVTEK